MMFNSLLDAFWFSKRSILTPLTLPFPPPWIMVARMSDNYEALELLGDQEYGEIRAHSHTPQILKRTANFLPLMTIGVFLFFVLDIVAFICIGKLLLDAKRSISSLDDIGFRDPYVGLKELYRSHHVNVSLYEPVINEPRLSAQISPGQPNEVFPIDSHRWLSDFGLLSPPDRHFQVSSKNNIQTIAQFNILDYGMENCSLKIRLPNRGDHLPHPYSLPTTWDTIPLSVCELDVKRPLKEWSISWATRPTCVRPLDVVNARIGGEVLVENFSCKSGSFVGYQIFCAENSPQCEVDVWTNQNATWGVFLEQYQTII